MDFHPGGWDELIKGAGRDATDMFNDVHSWVNYESMLAACLVGKLVDRGNSPLNKLVKKNLRKKGKKEAEEMLKKFMEETQRKLRAAEISERNREVRKNNAK